VRSWGDEPQLKELPGGTLNAGDAWWCSDCGRFRTVDPDTGLCLPSSTALRHDARQVVDRIMKHLDTSPEER
jgi:hypothetical protein